MRVQRAPLAAEQPAVLPPGLVLAGRPPRGAGPPVSAAVGLGVTAPPFSASVDLDVTALRRRLPDEAGVTAAVIARLLAACRIAGLLDADAALCVVRPAVAGVLGRSFAAAAGLSAAGIAAALRGLTPGLPAIAPAALTGIDLSGTRVSVTGDWGYGGRGVVTLGASVPTVGPGQADPGVSIAVRAVARLSFTVRDAAADAPAAVRVLDALARSIEDGQATGDLR
jgi:hypothetical protein